MIGVIRSSKVYKVDVLAVTMLSSFSKPVEYPTCTSMNTLGSLKVWRRVVALTLSTLCIRSDFESTETRSKAGFLQSLTGHMTGMSLEVRPICNY